MLSPSLAIVLLVLAAGIAALGVLGWVIARGWISEDAIKQQAWSVFDVEDLRTARPWETPEQHAERVARHGAAQNARPGAFGGAR
jgi:hypothetical protein